MRKKLPYGLLGGLAAGAIGIGSATAMGNYFYEQVITPKPAEHNTDPEDPMQQGRLWLAEENQRRDVHTTAVDGVPLHAYVLRSHAPDCHNWVICIHGYQDSADSMGVLARHYQELDWNILLPDLRGHGKSGGDYVGFGWDDRLDLVSWCSRIIRRDPQACILLHGISMGAATALITTGGPLPANVRGVISDCSYTTASDIMRSVYLKQPNRRYPVGSAFQALRSATRRRAKYDLRKADALAAVSRSHTPTLFIHGLADDFVPPAMMAQLYDHAKCPKEFLWIPRAGHARSAVVDPERYWNAVDRWNDRIMNSEWKL